MNRKDRPSRLIILSLFICMIAQMAHADGITYTYDAAGNRINLRIVTLRGFESGSGNDSKTLRHNLTNHVITVYPTPTEGELRVEIGNAETVEKASITIYGVSGSIIYYNDEPDAVNDIDLTPCLNGMYLMVIRIDGETSSWKIIKI